MLTYFLFQLGQFLDKFSRTGSSNLLTQETLSITILTGVLDAYSDLIPAQRSSATFWMTFFLIQKIKHDLNTNV